MSKKKKAPAIATSNILSIPGSVGCQKHIPNDNAEQYYSENPSWCFSYCDTELWKFSSETASDDFWNDILPRLKAFETQTWSEILISGKKQNHPIEVSCLSKLARERLKSSILNRNPLFRFG